jgi:glycosyltransferase involved in cell wall biosynthesis
VTCTSPANCTGAGLPAAATNERRSLVTVIIPAYNAASTIKSTLASVSAQTYRRLEIIVIDDGSRDETPTLVSRFAEHDSRVRLLQKENAGPAAARNLGIENANGEFIAPIDADDVWHPTKIEKQLAVIESSSRNVGAVTCWSRAINPGGQILFDLKTFDFRGEVFAPLIFWNFVQSGSVLFRRSVALEFGGYDVELASHAPVEDFKFNLQLAERCDFDLVPEFLFGWTLRSGSRSTDIDAMLRYRSIVVNDARARHPELPTYLFRWASARQNRECSRVYLERGRLVTGIGLTLAAALKDPMGALNRDSRRNLMGGLLGRLGLKKMFRPALHADAEPRLGRNLEDSFIAADSTTPFRSSTSLPRRRLHQVRNLRIARSLLVASAGTTAP